MPPRRLTTRKLLVASIGVATVNYVAACDALSAPRDPSSDNVVGSTVPPLPPTSGNLMAIDPPLDNPPSEQPPGPPDVFPPPTSGNLVAPEPPLPEDDAGVDDDAGSR